MAYTILVVDDNQDELNEVKTYIGKLFDNVVVLTTKTIQGCINILKNQPVDALLMDVDLSDGNNGVDFVSKLRKEKEHATLPVIFVSGRFVDLEYRLEAIKETTYIDYLLKPVEALDLKRALSNAFKYAEKYQYEQFIINSDRRLSTTTIDTRTFLYAKIRKQEAKLDVYILNSETGKMMAWCIHTTIKGFLKDIEGSKAIKRCGNSNLVNKKMITGYNNKESQLILKDGLVEVSLGRRYKGEFEEFRKKKRGWVHVNCFDADQFN